MGQLKGLNFGITADPSSVRNKGTAVCLLGKEAGIELGKGRAKAKGGGGGGGWCFRCSEMRPEDVYGI